MESNFSSRLTPSSFWRILKQTAIESSQDKVPRLGAALAYYTIFSIVPMLIIIIAVVGLAFGQEAAQGYIFDQLSSLLGEPSTIAIKEMIERSSQPATGIVAASIAFVTLTLGASGLFGELQDALNTIWGVENKDRSIWKIVQDRFFSFVTVIGVGFLLMVSLLINASLAAFGKWFGGWFLGPEIMLYLINFGFSLVIITSLFALMFKILPDARIAWSGVWAGAVLTALLFIIGKFAIGMYLGKSDIGNSFGAAGSLVILLVWVYYSAQIFLFGAEFTQVYANYVHSHSTISDSAVKKNSHSSESRYDDKKLTFRGENKLATSKNPESWRDVGLIALLAILLLRNNDRK